MFQSSLSSCCVVWVQGSLYPGLVPFVAVVPTIALLYCSLCVSWCCYNFVVSAMVQILCQLRLCFRILIRFVIGMHNHSFCGYHLKILMLRRMWFIKKFIVMCSTSLYNIIFPTYVHFKGISKVSNFFVLNDSCYFNIMLYSQSRCFIIT